jgi:CRISPR-associated endonuclease Cas2
MDDFCDFFDNYDRPLSSSRKFVLAIYDISLTKRRSKMVKLLESYGHRVQDSCFELFVRKIQIKEILSHAEKIIDKKTDSFRLYSMTEDDALYNIGNKPDSKEQFFIIC